MAAEHAGAATADALDGPPLLLGKQDNTTLTGNLLAHVWARPDTRGWLLAFTIAGFGSAMLLLAITVTIATGIGVWGNNIPVGWAFDITNFVWWIGIGHAGTLISAILFLFQQRWRTAINRFSETMTIFAIMYTGLFPLLHTNQP